MTVKITSVEFQNFKALKNYSIRLQHLNVLVGPNNCGKSTIISAFRALASGIKRARFRPSEWVKGPERESLGYAIPVETLPLSIENVHTDYADTDTIIIFKLSNKNNLKLFFPKDGGCILLPECDDGTLIRMPGQFRKSFPIKIGIVPVLGPIEHEEPILTVETVQKDLYTPRASRHFRNYWYHFPDGFDAFSELITSTWPGMEIQPPERAGYNSVKLTMFCLEDRITRELFWAGFGFQIWCQLLTHISISQDSTILIIDEPEIYLHPDVQRQLLGILRDIGPDVLIASHSTEIMGEADPSEIVLINKRKRSAERLRDIEGVQAALDSVGSVQNITLTLLARNRRVLFVEGLYDFLIIRKFARKVGFTELSTGIGLTPMESGGFSSWDKIQILSMGIEKTLGKPFNIGAIFDHDYFPDEEIADILGQLNKHLSIAHFMGKKK
jgi:energy-coupling factor transporter ATP-binding protein EcfA2